MTVLVTGSRGAVARALAGLLRERGLAVRAASSRPDGPDTVRCDLTDPSTFAAALKGVTSVFLYAEPSHAGAFIEEAAHAGVEHIVLLSSSSVLAPDPEDNPLAKSHLDVERALDASPIRSTSLRPGSFAGNALAWSWSLRSDRPISLPFPGSHSDPIHEADVAEAALAVLTDPGLGGRPYTLTGPESLTFAEQIDILSRVTGRTIPFRQVTREEWKRETAGHIPASYADSLLDWWQSSDGRPVELTRAVPELTGRPARTFATWARDHAGDFPADHPSPGR
ncbi:SDR family oxidoreductase [Streptosporangium sandarakinum]|uniref:SDR family oxidoreductase n=1 Tax=Streptosporangium sandarakinum TaxID=1260955 RepID=UPI0033A52D90